MVLWLTIRRSVMTAIKLENVIKSFRDGRKTRTVLKGLNLNIEKGQALAILGPNGAGKSTLLRCISNLLEVDSGSVQLGELKSKPTIGVLLEGNRSFYWRLSVMENIEYFAVLQGMSLAKIREKSAYLLDKFDLSDVRDRAAQKLSKGMQQRLALIITLINDPDIIILDEPTLGLDQNNIESLKEIVGKLVKGGSTLILTTHQIDIAEEMVGNIAILSDGIIREHITQAEFKKLYADMSYTLSFVEKIDDEVFEAIKEKYNVYESEGEYKCYCTEEQLAELIFELKTYKLEYVHQESFSLTQAYKRAIGE